MAAAHPDDRALDELPATVAPGWQPRPREWHERGLSRFAGAQSRPLFVGGCPRSGTTLLQAMLDSHPELAVPRETNFVRLLWWRRVSFGDLRERANRRRVAEWIFSDERVKHRRLLAGRDGFLDVETAIARVTDAPPTIGSIVATCFELYAELYDKPRWGDKRPSYNGFIGQLFRMFPDAQYVNVVRDPRGAVASQMQLSWSSDLAMPSSLARWEGSIMKSDSFAPRLRPDQFLDVRYEDLVTDPHGTCRRICEFAGLTTAGALERMVGGERHGRFRGPHELAAQPITTAPIERWRERMTPAQVALVEEATAAQMRRFGYRPDPELRAAPDPQERRMFEHRRHRTRRRWRLGRASEAISRLRYRRPVAAIR